MHSRQTWATEWGQASLPDGRALVFLPGAGVEVVLETDGIDDSARSDLAYAVTRQLAGG